MSEPVAPTGRLVFDGDCAFCSSCARWVDARLDADDRVVAWQHGDLEGLGLTVDDVASAAWWVAPDGSRSRGHLVAAAALSSIGGIWAPVGFALGHPPISWIARPVYALIAKYRHRMPGATPACRIDQ